jgi:radical SAM protein with 4Fe4S-binding SPASM domain
MTPKEYFNHPTVCPLPWTGFYLEPNGDIRNCSISGKILGNINNTPIQQILNSSENIETKADMLDNKKVVECKICWTFESLESKAGGISGSNRGHFKNKLSPKIINIIPDTTKFALKQVDLRWKNTCNLGCVYCGPNLSSTWAKELNVSVSSDEHAMEEVKKYIFENIDQLEYVYLCGGEPLLMKENAELISLIKEKNPNIYIRVNTNLTNINAPIYKDLLGCLNVHWILSVESTSEYFDFIRYGANWEKWLSNLKQLSVDTKNTQHKITFNMVWCALNAFAIFDSIDCFTELGFHSNSFFVQPLTTPASIHINNLKHTDRLLLKDMLISRMQPMLADNWLFKSYNVMLTLLDLTSTDNKTNLIQEYLLELDSRRHTNGIKLFAHLL